MSVEALKALKQEGLPAAQRLARDESVPRRRELLSAWLVDAWTSRPSTVVNVEYHDIFRIAPCTLSPLILKSLFEQQHVPEPVLESLQHASFADSSLEADHWIAAFEAMLPRSEQWPIMDLVWQRIEELCEDVTVAKKLRGIDASLLEQARDRDRLARCLFRDSLVCPGGRLTALYVETVYRNRYNLFSSSSKDYERHVRDKVQETLLEPVKEAMKGFRNWEAFTDTWRALQMIGREWGPLISVTEDAVRAGLERGDTTAWAVALQVDADMPTLIDLAISHDGTAFLAQTLARHRYEPSRLVDRIISSRYNHALPLLVGQDLVEAFNTRLAEREFGELDYICRVWEMRGSPVPLGPFAYIEDQEGVCALLRIHTLNRQAMDGDEALLRGIDVWPEDRAVILIRYFTACTQRDVSDAVLNRLDKGECLDVVSDLLLYQWQMVASPENCARLSVPDELASTMWELDKFADAMLRRMDVMSVIRTLAHVRGTRKMGGILVRAAMEDSQWSQYLHLVQKHDVEQADVARVAFTRADAALALLLHPCTQVSGVLVEMCKNSLVPEQVLVMANLARGEEINLLAKHLQGHSAVTMQAAMILGKSVDLTEYLAMPHPNAGVAAMCNAQEAVTLLQKASNPRDVIERLRPPVYAQLWLLPALWPLLVAVPRKDSGKLVLCHLNEMLKRGRFATLEAIVEHRSSLLRHADFERVCDYAAGHMSRKAILLVGDMCKQRPDLIADSANALTAVLVSGMPYPGMARLLTLVVSRRTSTSFKNHAPTILLAYVRYACTAPRSARLELEAGVHALCEAIAKGRSRDVQGEGIAGIGLGEGQYGEAETEVWARTWNDYRRKTYAGRG